MGAKLSRQRLPNNISGTHLEKGVEEFETKGDLV